MRCPNCSEPIQAGTEICPHCGQELAVTILSREERDNFKGLTIDGDGGNEERHYSGYQSSGRPQVKRINLSFDSSGWTGKLLVAIILAILVFFFLPLFLFIVVGVSAIVLAVWLLRMLKK